MLPNSDVSCFFPVIWVRRYSWQPVPMCHMMQPWHSTLIISRFLNKLLEDRMNLEKLRVKMQWQLAALCDDIKYCINSIQLRQNCAGQLCCCTHFFSQTLASSTFHRQVFGRKVSAVWDLGLASKIWWNFLECSQALHPWCLKNKNKKTPKLDKDHIIDSGPKWYKNFDAQISLSHHRRRGSNLRVVEKIVSL